MTLGHHGHHNGPGGWGIIIASAGGDVRQERMKFSKVWEFDMKAELYYMRNRVLEAQNFGR